MPLGQSIDLFILESGMLLQNVWLSIALAITTLIAAAWIAGRNHYDVRRAITYTIFTIAIGIGLNVMWFLDAGYDVFSHTSMRIIAGTMLLLFSMIIAYWIAAVLLHYASGLRKTLLMDIAKWMKDYSDSIYANIDYRENNSHKNPLKSTALQLKTANSTKPKKKSTKKRKKLEKSNT